MAFKFYDRNFLCVPENDVVGKCVFYADRYDTLIEKVESGQPGYMAECIDVDPSDPYSFTIKVQDEDLNSWDEEVCILAYYDPNYECKVAFSQGKQIQYRVCDTDKWEDITGIAPGWYKGTEYRIKPKETWYVHQDIDGHYFKNTTDTITIEFEGTEEECEAWIAEHSQKTRRMTNRELAKWLSEGKGEALIDDVCQTWIRYLVNESDLPVKDSVGIRAWGEDLWHEPLVKVNE